MSPPISQQDLDAIGRIVDRKIEEKLRPVKSRLDTHSGEYSEIVPAVHRKLSESQNDINDRAMGFERMMMQAVGKLDEKIETVAKSIPPAAVAAKGAEAASVAGAEAALRVEGKQDAARVALDRTDTNSLAARVKAHQTLIVVILQCIILALYGAYQHASQRATEDPKASKQAAP